MTATTSWNVTPLIEPLTREQVRAWRRENRGVRFSASPWTVLVVVPTAVIMVVMLAGLPSGITALVSSRGSPMFVIVALAVAGFAGFTIFGVVRGMIGRTERLMRLVRFAHANGFTFSARDSSPAYPGIIFRIGRERKALDHIARFSPRFLDIGNFQYTTGSGKNKKTRVWGFMALRLDRRVPHMLLDAKANNLLGSNLPAQFSKSQVLSLEGDFDRHFTLYCPREYERDALYVFTPDLMALLIDEAGAFDVEVVDDWMFVYAHKPLRMGDGEQLMRMLRIVDTVGAKAVDRTDYYADERIGDRRVNLVAPQGARLRRGIPWAAVIVAAVSIALWGASVLLR